MPNPGHASLARTSAPPPTAPPSSTPHVGAAVSAPPDGRLARLLLDALIQRSGRSVDHVAREILLRDRRTVQRWRAGRAPIPRPVREHVVRLLSAASGSDSR